MLRVTDTRTGRLVDVPAAPRRLLRSHVHLPGLDAGTADGTGIRPVHLRVMLVGDVLARVAELQGLQVVTVLTTTPHPAEDRLRALDRVMAVLGIHPPVVVGARHPDAALGGPADVHVTARGGGPADATSGVRIEAGPVTTLPSGEDTPPGRPHTPDRPDRAGAEAAAPAVPDAVDTPVTPAAPDLVAMPDAVATAGSDAADPLALRLLLLGHPYASPVSVTGEALAAARHTLREWRRQVADWAGEPSAPIPAELLRRSHEALAEDLGVHAVLDLLVDAAARGDVRPGAKFETFAHLDRVLGLDLAREIGH
ncbi:hypothetical protein AB0D98_08600 [Streptomyces sp. NPDC047987]|uniref:hypothetical protein n=1 Tax=unclassified Streptomyces TaxID=2593676 RepID=UPI00344A2B1B